MLTHLFVYIGISRAEFTLEQIGGGCFGLTSSSSSTIISNFGTFLLIV
jgi:hypothetical protein